MSPILKAPKCIQSFLPKDTFRILKCFNRFYIALFLNLRHNKFYASLTGIPIIFKFLYDAFINSLKLT